MKKFYLKFRIFLLTLTFGLAGVPFFVGLHDKLTEIKVDLPQIQSDTPIFVSPYNPPFYKKFTQADLIQNRDLSLYDSSSTFSNCFNHGYEISEFRKCQKQLSESRDFIFKHWKEKKRGYIIYEWSGFDCAGEIYIFIEPNSAGEYHVVMRSSGDSRYQNLEETKGYSVKYKRAKDDDDDYPFEIGTNFLVIFDENEKIVKRL